MVPLRCLEGDEIVEVSLLGPADDGPRMFPTAVEEAVLLEVTTCPCKHLEAPKTWEPAKQSGAPCPPAPQLQHQVPVATNLGTQEEPSTGLDPGL